jgi:hypothetical protein
MNTIDSSELVEVKGNDLHSVKDKSQDPIIQISSQFSGKNSSESFDEFTQANVNIPPLLFKPSDTEIWKTKLNLQSPRIRMLPKEINISFEEIKVIVRNMKDDLLNKVNQLPEYINEDYYEVRDDLTKFISLKQYSPNKVTEYFNLDPKFKELHNRCSYLSSLLIDISSSVYEFPDLKMLTVICEDYWDETMRHKPDIAMGSRRDMKLFHKKMSCCKSTLVMCKMYSKNQIWIDYVGGFGLNMMSDIK